MTDARPITEIIGGLLLAIAMREPDTTERAAKIEILRKDGWVGQENDRGPQQQRHGRSPALTD